MAKMLASSLLRTHFGGDILVLRNSPEPLFRVERKGLDEIYIETREISGLKGAEEAWCWKYRARQFIDGSKYDKVVFLDADSLALRNIDHLLEGEFDVAHMPERTLNIDLPQFAAFLTDEEVTTLKRPGVNSGTLAVRGEIFAEVMEAWERIDTGPVRQRRTCLDQGSWNRLVLDAEAARTGARPNVSGVPPWKTIPFERGEVQFPMYLDPKWSDYREAALVHCLGGDTREKLRFMFGLWMKTFFFDDVSTMVNLLEM